MTIFRWEMENQRSEPSKEKSSKNAETGSPAKHESSSAIMANSSDVGGTGEQPKKKLASFQITSVTDTRSGNTETEDSGDEVEDKQELQDDSPPHREARSNHTTSAQDTNQVIIRL